MGLPAAAGQIQTSSQSKLEYCQLMAGMGLLGKEWYFSDSSLLGQLVS